MALQASLASPSGLLRDQEFIGLKEVHSLLAKRFPVFVVSAQRKSKGSILATNGLGAWLVGRTSPREVVTLYGHSVTFEAIQKKRFDAACNPDFIERLLNLLSQIDPGRTLVPHRELLDVARQAQEAGWRECTESFCLRYRDQLSKRQYPFHIRISEPEISGNTETEGHFLVKELRFDDARKSNHPRRYVLVFDPVSRETRLAMHVIDLCRKSGAYVYPDARNIDRIMYNEPTIMKEWYNSLESDVSEVEVEPVSTDMGKQIRTLRMLGRISADELARKVGVSRATITHWESGRRRPQDPYHIKRLFEVLDPYDQHASEVNITDAEDRLSHLGDTLESAHRRLERIVKIQAEITRLQAELTNELAELEATFVEGKLVIPSIAQSHNYTATQRGADSSVSSQSRKS